MKYPKIEVARIETASAYGMKTPNDASKKCMADTVRRLAKQRPQIVVVNYKTAPGDTRPYPCAGDRQTGEDKREGRDT